MRICGLSVHDRDQTSNARFGVRRLAAAFESGSKLPHSKAGSVTADHAAWVARAPHRLFLLASRVNTSNY